jgi:hypothetical protein
MLRTAFRRIRRIAAWINALDAVVKAGVIAVALFLLAAKVIPPPPPPPCNEPPNVFWDNGDQGHNAYPNDTLTVQLEGCTTLLVTSGHTIGPDHRECGYDAAQICVLGYRAITARSVTVTGLDPGHTWYGITQSSLDAAVSDKRPQFFAPPNCGATGCSLATVYEYDDGTALAVQVYRP